ncbi:MAG: UDP-glucose/GDP-mannose dehydrogenase family protein [Planctomycetota bacterium]
MKLAIIGTGYVGLVTGTCLAETGNDVTCVDCDVRKIEQLLRGEVPIYEPGLAELISRNVAAGLLQFTTDLAAAVAEAKIVFLAVGTPPADDGSVDLSALWTVVGDLAPHLTHDAIVVLKSTVPVGTNAAVSARLRKLTGRECRVANNPEFLKEGAAIDDFMKPDRVVIGSNDAEVRDRLSDLYQPYLRTDKPLLCMSPESAEMTKYVANALLATKISFINEMANVCERAGADINEVRRGIGHDSRIGFAFLFPGVGYGGSCFPKDVRALAAVARAHGVEPRILDSVHEVNLSQKSVLFEKISKHFHGKLTGLTVGLWGLAFKPGTDDIREAPSLVLIDHLLAQGAKLRVYDPEAMDNVRQLYGSKLVYCEHRDEAIEGADALAIMTEWKHFINPDFDKVRSLMRQPVIFDGRNLYRSERMKKAGFTYHSIGRPTV